MTCTSCAARVEKKLDRMDGVTATVNNATEKAKVSHSGEVPAGDLIATVEATGYTAQEPAPPSAPPKRPTRPTNSCRWAGGWSRPWPFHRAAFTNARHGAATMDTLISVGTSAALR